MGADLTNAQWEVIRHLIPEPEVVRTGLRGGRPWRDPRDVMNGILWVLRTGAPWADLPRRYPPPQTCHRRFQKWTREGVLEAVLHALAEDLRDRAGEVAARPAPAPETRRRAAARRWDVETAVVLASTLGRDALAAVSPPPPPC
jgi:transposase